MNVQIQKKSNGKFVAAYYIPTKKRFRTTLTKGFVPAEAQVLDDLDCREYGSLASIHRALRKYKDKV